MALRHDKMHSMNYETLIHKLREDPEYLMGFDTDTLDDDVELTEAQWLGLEMFCTGLRLAHDEVQLLGEQLSDDKEVRYVLDTIDIEGLHYTLVHKMDVGSYLGYRSTLSGLAKTLKAAEILLDELINGDE